MHNYLTDTTFLNNTLADWLISIGIVLLTIVLGRFMIWLGNGPIKRMAEKTVSKVDDLLLNVFQTPFVCGVILLDLWIAIARLNFTESIDAIIGQSYKVLIVLNITWFFSRLFHTMCEHYFVPKLNKRGVKKFDEHIVGTISKTITAVLWIIGVVISIESLGVNVGALLTTMGIGGVAVALAAQDTVKNIIGGVTIVVDHPFRLQDRIQVAGYDGVVEEIGLRSTRLRTMNGRLVVIPNYKLMDSEIENISDEPMRKVTAKLGLTYSTSAEQMRLAMQILQKLPQSIPGMNDNVIASFTDFGDFAMQITFIYQIKNPRFKNNVFDVPSQVNLEILQQFNANGLNFAFPTQTLYVEKVTGEA